MTETSTAKTVGNLQGENNSTWFLQKNILKLKRKKEECIRS